MTVATTDCVASGNGNGVTTAFAFNFDVPYQADGVTPAILVQTVVTATGVRSTKSWPGDFTVTNVGEPLGGTVVFGTAPAAGLVVWIGRALDYDQPSAVGNQNFYPHTVENMADREVLQVQQVARDVQSSIRGPLGEVFAPLPDAFQREDTLVGFNSVGALALRSTVPVVYDISSSYTFNVVTLGADKTGVASSVNAFNAAIDQANAIASVMARGVTILVPDGIYKLDANLHAITGWGITFTGLSRQGAILSISAAGSLFTWQSAAQYGGLSRMQVTYPAAPNAAAAIVTISNAQWLNFEHIYCDNINKFCVMGTDAAHPCNYVTFEDIFGSGYNQANADFFEQNFGAGANYINVSVFVKGVGVPVADRVSTMTTAASRNFISIHGSWDTTIITGNTQCNRFWTAFKVSAPSYVVNNIFIAPCTIFDYCSNDAIVLSAVTNASGGIVTTKIQAGYIFSWSGHGIYLSGDNQNILHDFSGAKIIGAGKDGIHIEGLSTAKLVLDNMTTVVCNRLNGGYANINIAASIQEFTIIGGNHVDFILGVTFAWGGDYIVKMGADCGRYIIKNGNYRGGAVKTFLVADNTSRSAWRFIGDNAGGDYSGAGAGALFTVPATGVSWENWTPYKVNVNCRGLDGLAVNGQDCMGAPAAGTGYMSFELMPGEVFTPFYTLAHSITWYIHV
jgi:hypothetical protein